MSYQVIARKWRPQTFEEVTGQEAITRTLRNAIEHDRLHHAYIFSGSRGVGKTTTARLLAKALNCHQTDSPNPTPCSLSAGDICVSCKEISESRSIDVFEFDAASHTGVDDIRELILESININPARDRFKVFIIDEVHMLSNSSFNALLKTLEEPPPRVEFIMATTELHKLPDTILSRCQEFEFRSIPLAKIFDRLRIIATAEKIDISDEALKEIARSGEGSMRDAQSNFDQVISFSGETIGTDEVISALGMASAEMLTKTVSAISNRNPSEVLKVVDELISRGQDLRHFCRDLLSFFRDLLVTKLASGIENLLDTSILSPEEMRQYAEPFSESDLVRFFNSLSETDLKLHNALQPRYILEIGLVKLIEMRRVVQIEDILTRLAKLEALSVSGEVSKTSDTTIGQPSAEISISEKKTSITEIPAEEFPFPVSSTRILTEPEIVKEPVLAEEDLNLPIDRKDEFSLAKPEPSEFIKQFNANITDNFSIDVSNVTSEELEHIEDNWLDSAYEKKLEVSGDSLSFIPNASEIVKALIGSSDTVAAATTQNTEHAFKASAGESGSFSHLIPQLSAEEESHEIPELPDDPNDEQLLQYASAHPIVKKALNIFRGKIVAVKKI